MKSTTILLLLGICCFVSSRSAYVGHLPTTQTFLLEQPVRKSVEQLIDESVDEPVEELIEDAVKERVEELTEETVEWFQKSNFNLSVLNEVRQELKLPSADAIGCSFPIKGNLKSPSPLFIRPGSEQFYPFSVTGTIEVPAREKVELYCSQRFAAPLSGQFHVATCVGGTKFRIADRNYDITAIACSNWPKFVGKKTGSSCNGGTTLVDVGFPLNNSRFLSAYQVCFNELEEVTRYAYHRLEPGNNYFELGIDRIQFATGGFFGGRNANSFYTQSSQLQTLNDTLGGGAEKYFDFRRGLYLARGHLSAKADFVYGTQQRSTFLFINVAPQWQSFNGGNWMKVEDGLRSWVSKHGKFVSCWTGVWGVATLPNALGVPTALYLAHDDNNNGLIPVPRLYFRVVIEPISGRGVVLIGVNNPHLTLAEIQKDYVICSDVSSKISWLKWRPADILAGYSYACEVDDFRKRVTHLPNFHVTGLLY